MAYSSLSAEEDDDEGEEEEEELEEIYNQWSAPLHPEVDGDLLGWFPNRGLSSDFDAVDNESSGNGQSGNDGVAVVCVAPVKARSSRTQLVATLSSTPRTDTSATHPVAKLPPPVSGPPLLVRLSKQLPKWAVKFWHPSLAG